MKLSHLEIDNIEYFFPWKKRENNSNLPAFVAKVDTNILLIEYTINLINAL